MLLDPELFSLSVELEVSCFEDDEFEDPFDEELELDVPLEEDDEEELPSELSWSDSILVVWLVDADWLSSEEISELSDCSVSEDSPSFASDSPLISADVVILERDWYPEITIISKSICSGRSTITPVRGLD